MQLIKLNHKRMNHLHLTWIICKQSYCRLKRFTSSNSPIEIVHKITKISVSHTKTILKWHFLWCESVIHTIISYSNHRIEHTQKLRNRRGIKQTGGENRNTRIEMNQKNRVYLLRSGEETRSVSHFFFFGIESLRTWRN